MTTLVTRPGGGSYDHTQKRLDLGAICPREKALGEWLRASAFGWAPRCVRSLLCCANAPSQTQLLRYGSLSNPKTKLALRLQAKPTRASTPAFWDVSERLRTEGEACLSNLLRSV